MAGEALKGEDVSLKEHFNCALRDQQTDWDNRFAALEKLFQMEGKARDAAVAIAMQANNERLGSLNELRAVVTDTQKLFPTKDEVNPKFAAVDKRIDELKEEVVAFREWRSRAQGIELAEAKDTQHSQWSIGTILATALGALTVLMLIINFIFRSVASTAPPIH